MRLGGRCGLGWAVRSIALANQKGGVGKTTTAIHLAHGLSIAGNRVALVDLDPQGNATVALQGMSEASHVTPPDPSLLPIAERLWLLPAGSLDSGEGRRLDTSALSSLVARIEPAVDFMVVDSPPRMDEWGWAGVQVSDEVVVPVQTEFLAMHGLSQMLASLDAAAEAFPGKARLRGILPTMVDAREPVAIEVLEDLRRNLGGRMLQSVIFRDATLVEAASFGRSIFAHRPWAKGALCYAELTKELINGGSSTG